MTNDQRPTDSTPLAAPVTGVARGGHGTGTALEDTQLYDLADFSPVPSSSAARPAAVDAQPVPPKSVAAPAPEVAVAPVVAAPVASAPLAAAPAASAVQRTPARSRTTTTSRTRRVGAPVAGLAGFALAAGLAILIGVVLGGVPMPDGAAAGGETTGPTTPAAPADTDAPNDDDDDDDEGDGGRGGGGGNGNGNNGNGNGNGRGNGNDDD